MAPREDDRKDTSSRNLAPEDNPFIAFRRFADDQFQTLVSGLNAIPDLLSDVTRARDDQGHSSSGGGSGWHYVSLPSSRPNMETYDHMDRYRRSGGVTEAGEEAARALLIQARNANTGINPAKIAALYQDDLSHSSIFHAEPTWLSVDWFKHSRYSPIQIEQHRHAHQHGSMWRAAFEDLLAAELDKEQTAWHAWTGRTNDQRAYSSWAQTGIDWMLGLQCQGLLPPQLPSLYKLYPQDSKIADRIFSDIIKGNKDRYVWSGRIAHEFHDLATEISTFENDEIPDTRSQTELDVYEQMLGGKKTSEPTHIPLGTQAEKTFNKSAQASSLTPSKLEESTILSTLSTTEQTTLPDGTVTTKVVLKKRFSDGREESTETVSTTRGERSLQDLPSPPAPTNTAKPVKAEIPNTTAQEKKKSSGWFW